MPQIVYKNLRFKNAFSYRECEVPLDKQGLTFIRGVNADDDGFLGAGKSSIFEVLSTLLMGSAGKPTTFADMVNHYAGKNMEACLELEVGEQDYEIRQYQKHDTHGSGTKIIDMNLGRNVVPGDKSRYVHKWFREEKLRTSPTTFFHQTYLAQRMTNILLSGTDAQRKHKIIEMFGLDIYDKLGEAADKHMKLVEAELSSVSTFSEELAGIENTLSVNPPSSELKVISKQKNQELEDFKLSLDTAVSDLNEAQDDLRLAERRYAYILEAKELWQEHSHTYDVKSYKKISVDSVQDEKKLIQKLQQKYASLKDGLTKLRSRDVLVKQLQNLPESTRDHTDINDELTDAKSRLAYLTETELPQAESRKSLLDEMHELAVTDVGYEQFTAEWQKAEEDRGILIKKEAKLRHAIDHIASQLENDVCATCKRYFDLTEEDVTELKRELKTKRKKLKLVKAELHALNENTQVLSSARDVSKSLSMIQTKRKTKVIHDEIKSLQFQERSLTTEIESTQRRDAIKNQLKHLPDGSEAEIKEEMSFVAVETEAREDKYTVSSRIIQLVGLIRKLPKVKRKALVKKVSQLKRFVKQGMRDLNKLNHNALVADGQYDEVRSAERRKKKLEKAIKQAKKLQEEYDCYKALKISFGQKGLKHDRLHAIMADAADRTVPLYTNLFWPKGRVSLGLEPTESAIRFQLDRAGVGTSSRAISGGESHKAGLAFLFGLRDLKEIYTGATSNILILDEPFSHLDPQGREAFINVLQALKQRFASIFVVSHLTEVIHNDAWDQVWWAVRDNNESKLYLDTPPSKYVELAEHYDRRFA